MNVNVENLPKSLKKLTIEVSDEELKPFIKEAVAKISQELNIPGFRPGKAPQDIVEEKVGKLEVLQEAVKMAVPKFYVQAIVENKIEAIGEPKVQVKKLAPGNPMMFEAEVGVLPEIKLPDYKAIRLKPKKVKVDKAETEKSLKNLQKSRTTYATVKRGATKGDLVEFDVKISQNKVPLEGGDAKQQRLVMGEEYMLPAPKFDEYLLEMKAGDEKEFTITMPDDFHQRHLAGKDLDFKVKTTLIQEPNLPEINDDFAKALGRFKTLDELKKQLEDNLQKQAEMKEKGRFEMELMDKISDKTTVEIPDVLVEAELDKMLNELRSTVAAQGGKYEDYLKAIKKTETELRQELRERGVKRVKIGLILREIAKQEKITITDEELKAEIDKTKKKYQGYNQDIVKELDSEQYQDYVRGLLQNKKVFAMLAQNAQS